MNYRQSLRALFGAVLLEMDLSKLDKDGKAKAELERIKKQDRENFLKSLEKAARKLEYEKKHGKPMPEDPRDKYLK